MIKLKKALNHYLSKEIYNPITSMACAQNFSYARYENLFAHTVAVERLHLLKHNDLMHIFILFIYNSLHCMNL